jgi:cyanate permease
MKIPLLILLLIGIFVFIWKFYGRSGMVYTILFLGITQSGRAVSHFWGLDAEIIYWCLFAAVIITIYIFQRRKRSEQMIHKHHKKSGDDHVA